MASRDNLLISALHGTAMRRATEQSSIAEAVAELRELAGGRNDLLEETAGVAAGFWAASPQTHTGLELMAASLLISAGSGLNYDSLARWVEEGMKRGRQSHRPIHG